MKWYVTMLFLLVGFVGSVSAQQQQMDPKLVGTWETHDGPCSPCMLNVQANGQMSFTQAGSDIQIVFSRGTPNDGIEVLFPQGGKVDLSLNKTGNRLTGFYTNQFRTARDQMVTFDRK